MSARPKETNRIDPPCTIYEVVRLWADRTPDAPAIAASNQLTLTYRGLVELIDRVGSTLNAAGLGRGDRIAIVHSGGAEMAAAVVGIASYATAVPLNPGLTVGEFAIYLRDVGAKAVAIQHGACSAAHAATNRLDLPVFDIIPDAGNCAGLSSLDANLTGAPRDAGPAEPNDVAFILMTSGTTSSSKIVPLRHRLMVRRAEDNIPRFGLAPEDRVLNMMPLYHVGGLASGLNSVLYSGAMVIPLPPADVTTFLDHMLEFRPTFLMGAYTIYHTILRQADRYEKIISSATSQIRIVRSGAGQLDVQAARALETVFGAPVIQAYGSSESGFIASVPLPPAVCKEGSVGFSMNSEVAIMDEDGQILDPDQLGEIVVRGPMVIDGYDNDPEANAAAFVDGWYRTGDVGYFDMDGYLFLTGRIKEMINRGGQKISPREVDDALVAHPAVAAASTFSVPHPTLGEEVAAAVVVKTGLSVTEQSLSDFLRRNLATFKVPRQFVFVDEIPKGPTGKVHRHKLAAEFGLARGVTSTAAAAEAGQATALESKLQALWASALGLDHVGLHDDFFLLGGDSLQAVDLFLAIEAKIGHRLSRAVLFEAGTVAEMAARIENDAPSSCVVPIQPEGEAPPFFCVHDQNGQVLNFRDLARHLDNAQPFYGIQSIGLDGKAAPFTRMEDMATHYVREIRKIQPTGPYYIGGYSFGGRVAYAMAQRLRAAGESVALLALLDTYYLSGQRNVGTRQWLARHRERLAELRLREVPGYLAQRLQNVIIISKIALRSRLIPALWRIYERLGRPVPRILHRPAVANDVIRRNDRPQPYDGDAVLFQAELPATKHREVHEGWRNLISGGLEIRPIPGRHSDFLEEPHVRTLAAKLSACLAERRTKKFGI